MFPTDIVVVVVVGAVALVYRRLLGWPTTLFIGPAALPSGESVVDRPLSAYFVEFISKPNTDIQHSQMRNLYSNRYPYPNIREIYTQTYIA